MPEYTVWVKLRHKDSFREVSTHVTVATQGEDPIDALLVGLQLACTHREGFMPIDGRIVKELV